MHLMEGGISRAVSGVYVLGRGTGWTMSIKRSEPDRHLDDVWVKDGGGTAGISACSMAWSLAAFGLIWKS
jgi:hypothetical protein